ncbi:YozE family protein [Fructobacillus fructosus]|uniref:YozE family protein n=1 Tax=Fructobacillus fructosus TaxID=1631 RepID=UPI00403423BE
MRLKEYILKFVDDDSPLGDFARDVQRDKNYPDEYSFETESTYLLLHSNEFGNRFINSYEILVGLQDVDN